jgi:hypothetical protein
VPFLIDRYLKPLYQSLPEGHMLAHAIGRLGSEARLIRQLLLGEGML